MDVRIGFTHQRKSATDKQCWQGELTPSSGRSVNCNRSLRNNLASILVSRTLCLWRVLVFKWRGPHSRGGFTHALFRRQPSHLPRTLCLLYLLLQLATPNSCALPRATSPLRHSTTALPWATPPAEERALAARTGGLSGARRGWRLGSVPREARRGTCTDPSPLDFLKGAHTHVGPGHAPRERTCRDLAFAYWRSSISSARSQAQRGSVNRPPPALSLPRPSLPSRCLLRPLPGPPSPQLSGRAVPAPVAPAVQLFPRPHRLAHRLTRQIVVLVGRPPHRQPAEGRLAPRHQLCHRHHHRHRFSPRRYQLPLHNRHHPCLLLLKRPHGTTTLRRPCAGNDASHARLLNRRHPGEQPRQG